MKNHLLGNLIALLSALALTQAYANPIGGQVVSGAATIANTVQNSIPTTTVTQTSDKAIIDWKGFDIGQQEHTHFQQPNANSIAVNRIESGNNPSVIAGRLTSTGQVWLLNYAGFLLTGSSKIDVAGLVVTTNNSIKDSKFLAGEYYLNTSGWWSRSDENSSIIIQKGAEISVAQYGAFVLVAPNISNQGNIKINTMVAAGDKGTFYFNYNGNAWDQNMIYIAVAGEQKMETLLTSTSRGRITVEAGHAQMAGSQSYCGGHSGDYIYFPMVFSQPMLATTGAMKGVLDQAINTKNIPQASFAVIERNGEIVLK